MNWKAWLGGMISALLTAIGGGGVLLVADPEHFNFTPSGLAVLGKVLAIVALGAFFNYLKTHPIPGSNGTEPSVAPGTTGQKLVLIIGLGAGLLLPLGLTGCPSGQTVSQKSRDVIATASGVISNLDSRYKASCEADSSQTVCGAIGHSKAALNVSIDALEAYCEGTPIAGDKPFKDGGPCSPVSTAGDALKSALDNLNRAVADLKAVVK